MANYAHIHCRKRITKEKVIEAFAEANEKYFKNLLNFYIPQKENEVFCASFNNEGYWELQFWINSSHLIEVRHGGSRIVWWADLVLEHYFAYKFNGYIIDDGTGEKEYPNIEKFLTFEDYSSIFTKHLKGWKKMYMEKMKYQIAKQEVPKNVYNALIKPKRMG